MCTSYFPIQNGGLTVPALVSEEPVPPSSVVHKHHDDQGQPSESVQGSEPPAGGGWGGEYGVCGCLHRPAWKPQLLGEKRRVSQKLLVLGWNKSLHTLYSISSPGPRILNNALGA